MRNLRRLGRRERHTGLGVGQSEGKRPLGRPGRRWKDDIEMSLQEIEWLECGLLAGRCARI